PWTRTLVWGVTRMDMKEFAIGDLRAHQRPAFRLWMQIVLPSGSKIIAMRQTGVWHGSIRKVALMARRCSIAASKSSTSNAAVHPSGLGLNAGAEPMGSAYGPNSYSVHFPCSESVTVVGLRPSAPS